MSRVFKFINHIFWCFSTEASMATDEEIKEITVRIINELKREGKWRQ